ncbi:hypothetical protein N9Q54_00885 [Octadecabacter sp.]|nr:hypothetical protein [Octadecabacter sp.]
MQQVEVDRLNQWFSERIATAGYTKTSEAKLPLQLVREIHDDMKRMGNHPSQLPKIDVNSDPREMSQFIHDVNVASLLKRGLDADKITIDEYSAGLCSLENGTVWKLRHAQFKRAALLDELRKKYRHPEKTRGESCDPNIDCDAEDYVLPQMKWDEADPEVIRYRIMCGKSLLPPPTWQNAVDDYLRQYNSAPKQRSAQQKTKHSRAVISQCEKISAAFPYGMKTALTDIDAEDVRDFIRNSPFGTWDVWLNVLNVEAENAATELELYPVFYGPLRDKPMAWRATSALYSCVLRPLCWAGLLLEHKDQGSKRSDAVYLKTPLWAAWSQLDTDDIVEPAQRH